MIDVADMQGLDAAMTQLDAMEAADAATSSGQGAGQSQQSVNAGQKSGAQGDQHAAQTPSGDQRTQTESNTDARAAAEIESSKSKVQSSKSTEGQGTPESQKAAEAKGPSRYQKAQERAKNSWEEINRTKAELKAEREKFEGERTQFQQQRQAEERAFSPEQYEEAAKRFEAGGKFDLADAAREKAAELRKNPPSQAQAQANSQGQPGQPTAAQRAQYQAHLKEWWGKAAVDFPAVAKEGTPENGLLKEFLTKEPDAVRSPKGMYYAARMVAAETAAARVPGLETELGTLRAKVKELEALTAPGGPGSPARLPGDKPFEQQSDGEQLAELNRLANEMGTFR